MDTEQTLVNIVCLKWGRRYSADYVNILYAAVQRYLHRPFRFVCITDRPWGLSQGVEAVEMLPNPQMPASWPWPNVFLKLLITADGVAGLSGPTLFLDLDVAITGELDCFFDYMPGKNCMIHNWVESRKTIFIKAPAIGNSSVFRFEAGKSNYICETFLAEMSQAVDQRYYRTEQAFLTHAMKEVYWWPAEWVKSFKRHAMRSFPLNYLLPPQLPVGCRILAFHGKPDPDEALVGYKGKRLHHYSKPATWLSTYWSLESAERVLKP
jgi:hypothetical protein